MKNCTNCKWDRLNPQGHERMIQCGQGHDRLIDKVIENCHAWEEKKECWCEKEGERRIQLHDYIYVNDGLNSTHYQMRPPEIPKYCPRCGRKLKED